LIRSKDIRVFGIDYDEPYVTTCKRLIAENDMKEFVHVQHVSVCDYHGGPYDAVYFSGSLMIMPDPVAALKHVTKMLTPKGLIYCTQTLETKKNSCKLRGFDWLL
jgi:2-polyprenyl-3-methyl-5-hydroxy-6-metoxy-1,4-benzoquinol methylase